MKNWVLGSGALCVAALYLASGNVALGNVVAGVCELIAVASGIVCLGLLDGE